MTAVSSMLAATGALSAGGCDRASAAERSHPTSKVRGRSREDPMPKGQRPRGVTPRPRSGAAAESTRLRRRRNGGEELPRAEVRWGDERSYPASKVRGRGQEEQPTPEARGGGWEDQPHVQGAVAVRAQEGLEELSHVEGQEGQQ